MCWRNAAEVGYRPMPTDHTHSEKLVQDRCVYFGGKHQLAEGARNVGADRQHIRRHSTVQSSHKWKFKKKLFSVLQRWMTFRDLWTVDRLFRPVGTVIVTSLSASYKLAVDTMSAEWKMMTLQEVVVAVRSTIDKANHAMQCLLMDQRRSHRHPADAPEKGQCTWPGCSEAKTLFSHVIQCQLLNCTGIIKQACESQFVIKFLCFAAQN